MTLQPVSKPRHDPVTAISPIADIIAEARNGKPLDRVARCRYTFHFHSVVGADKEDVGVKTPAKGVGDGEGREDVSSRATSRYQYLGSVSSHFMIWI